MEQRKENKLIRQMIIALIASFTIGFILMILNEKLNASGNETIWNLIYYILLADVTAESGVGILFVIQTLFLNGLKLIIIPLVFTSLLLAMDSITDLKKLGRMAYKTVGGFLGVYILGCIVASFVSTWCVKVGIFTVSDSIVKDVTNLTTVSSANPMSILIAMVPDNIITTFSNNNAILAVVFIAVVCGISLNTMGKEGESFKNLIKSVAKLIQICVDFLINKVGPVAIFAMITRAMALYGLEEVKSVLVYVAVTCAVLIIYLIFGYTLIG